jgi:hypothetical protein
VTGAAASVSALYRYPLKGFTPQRIERADLAEGGFFPGDRLYAVEAGPSGFDPAAPAHISKMKFAVLARMPQVAAINTYMDVDSRRLVARRDDMENFAAPLAEQAGRDSFAAWLERALADVPHLPFRVLEAPDGHRFMDSRSGFVSLINLASLRDLSARMGQNLHPLRFRANLYVEGWAPWAELDMAGASIEAGGAVLEVIKRTDRCTATHVDPGTAQRDADVIGALRAAFGHIDCGLYARIVRSGAVADGDAVRPA